MHGSRIFLLCLGLCISALLYCEILADYIKLLHCSWPRVNVTTSMTLKPLYALILADPHLLGPLRGHWLDKFYREWHMHRSFQAAMTLFHPKLVFVLGDLFDEGELVNHLQFDAYVERFYRLFRTPADTTIISAVGNHDIGFHYKMHPYFTSRFDNNFNNTGVKLYTFSGVHFVFINSMAMQNDGCEFCQTAQRDLKEIATKLNCLKNSTCDSKIRTLHGSYSRPVLMQHFPTYRISDKVCQTYDAPIIERYRENWEVLSKDSTDLLGKLLHPRLAFSGHSHHYCEYKNRLGINEYTVASFSWRNKINPSFILATFTSEEHGVAKCEMTEQLTVYTVYVITGCFCFLLIILHVYNKFKRTVKKKEKITKHQNKNL